MVRAIREADDETYEKLYGAGCPERQTRRPAGDRVIRAAMRGRQRDSSRASVVRVAPRGR